MAYIKPTPAEIKARYPDFAAVPDVTIQAYIEDCPVDDSWFESDYKRAIMLWACHEMSINGIGGDDVAGYAASGVKSLSSGGLSVSFDGGDNNGSIWDASKYGKQFYLLLRQNKAGPRSAASSFRVQSGYAKDVPWGY